tara:strand:+ start:1353 stop:3767 length:2415 start_codon:yes stop_codon:yes gene_type:complete
MVNLFEKLFNLENGYVNEENIITLKDENFIESFDKNKLGYILNNIEDIKTIYRDNARNDVSLEKYYTKSKNINGLLNILNVKYIQNDNGLYGRYQAMYSLSGQGMVREARHTIFNEFYIDIDMDNCHPVITKWICDNLDIECSYLSKYIKHREVIIQELIKLNPEFDREFIKKYILSINYGCGDKKFNLLKNKNNFLINYRKEIIEIQKLISSKFHKFRDINNEIRNEKKKNYNLDGSTLSHICQYVENQLLMIIINFLQNDKEINIQDSILCFDGLMINKKKFNMDFLKDIENMFYQMEIPIKMSIKDMNLDNDILKKCKYKKSNNYKYEKKIDKKDFQFNDEYFYMDFINDLIKDNKTWDYLDLNEFIISNINRVLFRILTQKNAFFGRYNSQNIQIIEPSGHLINFVDYNERGVAKLYTKPFYLMLNTMFYNEVKSYNNLEFIPYTRDCKPLKMDGRDFNMFQGFKAKLVEKEDINMNLIQPILDHWEIVLANSNKSNFKYQLSYFHKGFKYPNQKTKVMLLFKSDQQQIGKGIILNNIIGELIYGRGLYKPNNGLSFINDRFNDDQAGALFSLTEELSTIDDSYNSTFDRLKSLSCDDFLKIEPKFGKKYDIQNFTNYVFNTNNKFPVKIEQGDARFAVFECDERYHKDFDYFAKLAKSINQESADHLYSYIYHLDDPVEPRNIPTNDFYESIKFNSSHSSVRFLYSVQKIIKFMESDKFEDYYGYDSWEKLLISSIDDLLIGSSKLNEIYKIWCKFNGEKATSMARFKTYTDKYIVYDRNSQHAYYDFNTLNLPILNVI